MGRPHDAGYLVAICATRSFCRWPNSTADSFAPTYRAQVIVSYYQAGRICDYIQNRWGADKLLDMVHSFAQLKTTPEVIQENLGHVARGIRQAISGLALQAGWRSSPRISMSGTKAERSCRAGKE